MMKTIYLIIVMVLVSVAGYATDPRTIVRKPGPVGERIESTGKGSKENTVHVRAARIINGEVIQERIVVAGADVFGGKVKAERKAAKKETPQPKSIDRAGQKLGK